MPDPLANQPPWNPTQFRRLVAEPLDTSMGTAKVKTDATYGYLKALGNRQGPHPLACELVGSALAQWFGLSVPEFAVLPLPAELCFDLPRGARTQPGPAFVSRHMDGRVWGGSEVELRDLENPDDITRLVVFDTWVRNCDRHPPDLAARKPNRDNVYLADTDRPGRSRLVALDHGHCFDCGRDLNARLADIDKVRDERVYGLFPAFRPLLDRGQLIWCESLLRSLSRDVVEGIVAKIPPEWDVADPARTALVSQIVKRAAFVAAKISSGWPIDGGTDSPAAATETP